MSHHVRHFHVTSEGALAEHTGHHERPEPRMQPTPVQHAIDVALAQEAFRRARKAMAAKRIEGESGRTYIAAVEVYKFAKSLCRSLARNSFQVLTVKQREGIENVIGDWNVVAHLWALHTEAGRQVPDVLRNLPKKPPTARKDPNE